MEVIDYIVIAIYLLGIVAAGVVFAGRMKDSKEMFAAGRQSPWWVSGLSGFMTMFSAGTFVVWGGIAYRYGVVAIVINLGYGVAALLVGRFVAGRWRQLGVESASEFLRVRFGGSVVQLYTWFKGAVSLFSMGGGVYALSKIVCALIPLPTGHFLADPATGNLSVALASVALCLMVTVIAVAGGLWAVLVTDVLQFVILTVSVMFVVPLVLATVGGWGAFLANVPDRFTAPVAADFTWWFIVGWMIVNFFNIGAEWAFVQRYLCVSTVRDARKAAYLFGILYLVSPALWMLPPLVYRALDSSADPEQAYILACQLVLPAGMVGLMVAAMVSATASMATTRLNVFAGAFTVEVYERMFDRSASEKRLVLAGRVATVLLGGVVLAGALLIPRYGYTSYLIEMNTLLNGPLLLPTIWGLFSRKIGLGSVWATILAGFTTAFVVKFGLSNHGFLSEVSRFNAIIDFIAANKRLVDLSAGIVFPVGILATLEIALKGEDPGWRGVMQTRNAFEHASVPKQSALPAKMVVVALALVGVTMAFLSASQQDATRLLLSFSVAVLGIAGLLFAIVRKSERNVPR